MTRFQYRPAEFIDELIWQRTDVPDHIKCYVRRNNSTTGRLVIENVETGEEIVSISDWTLTYGAQFGADQDDIDSWTNFTQPFIEAINNGTELDSKTVANSLQCCKKTSTKTNS